MRGDRDVLGELVPDQPVTGDAGGDDQQQDRHAGHPGEPARPAVAVERELAQQVQHHDDHHGVGRVAMQAAHHAARIPLLVRQVLDRAVGRGDAGIEEDVEVDAADRDDPIEEEAERAQVVERVPGRREGAVEQALEPLETQSAGPCAPPSSARSKSFRCRAAKAPARRHSRKREPAHAGERDEPDRHGDERRVVEAIAAGPRVVEGAEQAHAVDQALEAGPVAAGGRTPAP